MKMFRAVLAALALGVALPHASLAQTPSGVEAPHGNQRRNQLPGKVTATKVGSIMAEVTVEVEAAPVVAAITRSSVEHLNLQPGDTVRVIVKSTEVMIAK